MKFHQFFIAPALLTLSSLAMAGGFDGLSVQAGIGASMAQTELKNYSPDGKVSDSNAVGSLALGYSKSFGQFNLAGGVFTILGNQKAGSLQSNSVDTGGVWSDEFKVKKVWGLSIEPGYNLNDSTLVYAKFSYVKATGENVYDYTGSICDACDKTAGSAEANHHGVGIGAGVKLKLAPNLYGFAEFQQLDFNKKTYYGDAPETYKPKLVSGSVGIGYQF